MPFSLTALLRVAHQEQVGACSAGVLVLLFQFNEQRFLLGELPFALDDVVFHLSQLVR